MKPITTKSYLINLCFVLIAVLGLAACKKDALKVDTEKYYVQASSAPVTDLLGGGMSLTLKPNGTADINPGGDIVWSGTYNISGKKITVKVPDINIKYNFTIVSNDEIHGENGQILKLTNI